MYVNIDVTMANEFYNLQLPMSALIDFRSIISVKHENFSFVICEFWMLVQESKTRRRNENFLFSVNTFKTAVPQNDNDDVM